MGLCAKTLTRRMADHEVTHALHSVSPLLYSDSPLVSSLSPLLTKDELFASFDVAQSYTPVEVTETYTSPTMRSVDVPIEPTMAPTPSIELIAGFPTKLEVASIVARRSNDPEPEHIGFDARLKRDVPVCYTNFSIQWSPACIEAMAFEFKRLDRGKHRREANTRVPSMWDTDSYMALDCSVCGSQLAEHSDHLGMNIFEDHTSVYLTMQSYIEVMTEKGRIDVTKGRSCKLRMSDDITNMEPCTKDEGKLFVSSTGMVGWLSATGRPDSRVYHSHGSQHMAAPVKGALKAVMCIA